MKRNLKPDRSIDLIGLYCPVPILKTREALDEMKVGEILEVLADDPAAEEDLIRFAKRTGQELLEIKKEDEIIRFLFKKAK
ncbi:MAG: sulfurtransferase TusA family protein [Candidatus Hydrothermarchaeota archaeon]